MEYNEKKQTLTIFQKEEKISTLARKFASLSGKQVYDFFSNRTVELPRTINCLAFYSVLNERLKTLTAAEVTKDQAVRLQSYDSFSEVELYDLFSALCATKESYRQYRINLFTIILRNYADLKLTDGEINYLNNVQKSPIEKVNLYVQYVTSASYEMVNTFDGQDIKKLEAGFRKSAVIANVIELAEKYGIELKQKYTKEELVEEVKNYLKICDKYTLDLESEIDNATVSDLNLFCSKRNIPLASSMNKEYLIKYFFFILEHAQIPTTSVTNVEIPEEFKPLEFKVDLSAYKGFKNEVTDPTKQIIIWAGKEEEQQAEEVIAPLAAEESTSESQAEQIDEATEEVTEAPEEIVEDEAAEEVVEEQAEDVQEEALEPQTEQIEEPQEEIVDEALEETAEEEIPEEVVEEQAEDVQEEALEPQADDLTDEEKAAFAAIDERQKDDNPQEEAEEPQKEPEETIEDKEVKEKQESNKKERLALSFGNVEENNLYGDDNLYKYLKPPVKLIASIIGITLAVAVIIALIVAYIPR